MSPKKINLYSLFGVVFTNDDPVEAKIRSDTLLKSTIRLEAIT